MPLQQGPQPARRPDVRVAPRAAPRNPGPAAGRMAPPMPRGGPAPGFMPYGAGAMNPMAMGFMNPMAAMQQQQQVAARMQMPQGRWQNDRFQAPKPQEQKFNTNKL